MSTHDIIGYGVLILVIAGACFLFGIEFRARTTDRAIRTQREGYLEGWEGGYRSGKQTRATESFRQGYEKGYADGSIQTKRGLST